MEKLENKSSSKTIRELIDEDVAKYEQDVLTSVRKTLGTIFPTLGDKEIVVMTDRTININDDYPLSQKYYFVMIDDVPLWVGEYPNFVVYEAIKHKSFFGKVSWRAGKRVKRFLELK